MKPLTKQNQVPPTRVQNQPQNKINITQAEIQLIIDETKSSSVEITEANNKLKQTGVTWTFEQQGDLLHFMKEVDSSLPDDDNSNPTNDLLSKDCTKKLMQAIEQQTKNSTEATETFKLIFQITIMTSKAKQKPKSSEAEENLTYSTFNKDGDKFINTLEAKPNKPLAYQNIPIVEAHHIENDNDNNTKNKPPKDNKQTYTTKHPKGKDSLHGPTLVVSTDEIYDEPSATPETKMKRKKTLSPKTKQQPKSFITRMKQFFGFGTKKRQKHIPVATVVNSKDE